MDLVFDGETEWVFEKFGGFFLVNRMGFVKYFLFACFFIFFLMVCGRLLMVSMDQPLEMRLRHPPSNLFSFFLYRMALDIFLNLI
jgi:hypothetical protein